MDVEDKLYLVLTRYLISLKGSLLYTSSKLQLKEPLRLAHKQNALLTSLRAIAPSTL